MESQKDLDKAGYATIISSRLNQVQTLMSAMYAFIVAVIATVMLKGNSEYMQKHQIVFLTAALVILFWAHVFVTYQAFASALAIHILRYMEPEGAPSYFTANRRKRVRWYVFVHTGPSFFFVLFPLLFIDANRWAAPGCAAILLAVSVLTTRSISHSILNPCRQNRCGPPATTLKPVRFRQRLGMVCDRVLDFLYPLEMHLDIVPPGGNAESDERPNDNTPDGSASEPKSSQ